jgi:glycosyltransferase involved in cell wall biosynthesis
MDREVAEYHEADYIIVSSSMARRTFIEQGVPEGKVMVVPEGVDTLRFHAKQKSDTVFRPIFVGHIGFRKGVLYLLEAIRKLRLKNCKVWLIGSIEEAIKPFLAQYDDLFTHVGSMAQENLDKYYSEASVFVLPSVEDGWGLVTGEAMSCGLPVVVSANAGSAEMVRDGVDGFITPARDVQLLAEKLLYLYEHEEERRTMGAAARERATQFTWEQYGQRMIETFHMILGKSPNNSS